MITIGRIPRIAAAVAALAVNLALAGGLTTLAHHYEDEARAARPAAFAAVQAAAVQCRPERAAPG